VPAGHTVPVEVVFGGDRPSPARADLVYEGTVVASAAVAGEGGPPTTASFRVTGRPDGRPVSIRVVSDTFRPAELWGVPDERTLGVQVMAARVGNDALQRAGRRAPFLERAQQLRWLDTYDRVLVNSAFTAGWVARWWGRRAEVLYPAVPPLPRRPPAEKEPVILSVGRFFTPERGHSKKQLEMVVAFRRLVEQGVDGWSLHLVGGCQDEDRPYLERVRAIAAGLPVVFHVDAPGSEVRDLYARASLYWQATGLFEDPGLAPERQEHFGIAVVEAMSAGCVPVVYGAAGPGETVEEGVAGLHFRSLDGLVRATRRLVDDEVLRARLSDGAVGVAARYSPDALAARLDAVVASLPPVPTPGNLHV
jgi:glycosyltransferase involved in cell wall biosynthesis